MVTGVWAKKTCEELDFLMNLQPDNRWCSLYKAQVLLVNRQKQEAEWTPGFFPKKNKEKDTHCMLIICICVLWQTRNRHM